MSHRSCHLTFCLPSLELCWLNAVFYLELVYYLCFRLEFAVVTSTVPAWTPKSSTSGPSTTPAAVTTTSPDTVRMSQQERYQPQQLPPHNVKYISNMTMPLNRLLKITKIFWCVADNYDVFDEEEVIYPRGGGLGSNGMPSHTSSYSGKVTDAISIYFSHSDSSSWFHCDIWWCPCRSHLTSIDPSLGHSRVPWAKDALT